MDNVINKKYTPESALEIRLKLLTDLDARSCQILAYIVMNANSNGVYNGTYENLMDKFDISRGTLATIMRTFQSKKLIDKVSEGYKINNDIRISESDKELVIRFNDKVDDADKFNENKDYAPLPIREAVDEKKLSSFVKEMMTSYNRLYSQKQISPIKDDMVVKLVMKYNDSGRTEKFSKWTEAYIKNYVDKFPSDTNLNSDFVDFCINCVKIYEEKYENENRTFYADIACDSIIETYNSYEEYIDKLKICNENKMLLKGLIARYFRSMSYNIRFISINSIKSWITKSLKNKDEELVKNTKLLFLAQMEIIMIKCCILNYIDEVNILNMEKNINFEEL